LHCPDFTEDVALRKRAAATDPLPEGEKKP
jgi:hypothetical protein